MMKYNYTIKNANFFYKTGHKPCLDILQTLKDRKLQFGQVNTHGSILESKIFIRCLMQKP